MRDALTDLMSQGCACGRPKKSGKSVCYGCWKRLPKDLQRRLYKKQGYNATYQEALTFLELIDDEVDQQQDNILDGGGGAH